MLKTYHYALSDRSGSNALSDLLRSAGLTFSRDPLPTLERCYYDSFDWRLYAGGLLLFVDCRGERMRLCLRESGSAMDVVAVDVNDVPRFAGELPRGLIRDRVAPLLGERRLLPLMHLKSRCEEFRIMDGEQKTVVRASVERHRVDAGDRRVRLRDRLEVIPVRGFAEPLRDLLPLLDGSPSMEGLDAGVFEEALQAIDRHPLDYRARPRMRFRPGTPVGAAARAIFAHLIDVIEANEDGVRQDLDPGFLHDLRVAVRRTRTLLGAMKRILEAPHFEHYRGEFAWLAAASGPVRDLDVQLGAFPVYATMLEPAQSRALEPLRAALRARRMDERRRLLENLASHRYRVLKKGWRALLDDDASWEKGKGQTPVAEAAAWMVDRRGAKLVARGAPLTAESSDDELHELRKQAKKLRYLNEMFARCLPAERARKTVKAMKELQKKLGKCQDLSVHHGFLEGVRETVASDPAGSAALGALLDTLARHRNAAVEDALRSFARFADRVDHDRNSPRNPSGDCDQESRL